MSINSTRLVAFMALAALAVPAHAGRTCLDGVTDKSSGCPLDFTEKLIAFDDFDDGIDGWSSSTLSEPICGSDPILVLADNGGAIASKTYGTLPAHTHVRVQATAYFIDDWQGESAAIKLDGQFAWTQDHDQRSSARALNVCGNPGIAESSIGVPIDITVAHTASTLTVAALTTIPAESEAHLALDDVRVSVFTHAP